MSDRVLKKRGKAPKKASAPLSNADAKAAPEEDPASGDLLLADDAKAALEEVFASGDPLLVKARRLQEVAERMGLMSDEAPQLRVWERFSQTAAEDDLYWLWLMLLLARAGPSLASSRMFGRLLTRSDPPGKAAAKPPVEAHRLEDVAEAAASQAWERLARRAKPDDLQYLRELVARASPASDEVRALQKVLARSDPPRPLQETFGNALREARLSLRLSQRALSKSAGISANRISLIEQGQDCLLSTVEALAKHLDRSPVELLTPPPSRPPRR